MTVQEEGDKLIEDMFSFIPLTEGGISELISAKFCAIISVKKSIQEVEQLKKSCMMNSFLLKERLKRLQEIKDYLENKRMYKEDGED